jgi:hypothetical protein
MERESLLPCSQEPITAPYTKLTEELIVSNLVKKFLIFYGTRKFVTVFTKARCGPYSESDECNARPSYSIYLKILRYFFPIYVFVSQVISLLDVLKCKQIFINFLFLSYVLQPRPIWSLFVSIP